MNIVIAYTSVPVIFVYVADPTVYGRFALEKILNLTWMDDRTATFVRVTRDKLLLDVGV